MMVTTYDSRAEIKQCGRSAVQRQRRASARLSKSSHLDGWITMMMTIWSPEKSKEKRQLSYLPDMFHLISSLDIFHPRSHQPMFK